MADAAPGTSSSFDLPRMREETLVARPVLTRTAWGPVLAGAVAAIGAQLLFTVLGIALGATVTDVSDAASADSVRTASAVAGAWWLITGTLALLIGGMVLGRVAGIVRGTELYLNAFTLWAVTAVFGFAVLWSGAGISTAAGGMYAAALQRPNTAPAWINTSGPTVRTGENGDRVLDRTAEQIAPAAEQARRAARTASWWSVLGLLLGIAAAIAGAWALAPDRIVARPVYPAT